MIIKQLKALAYLILLANYKISLDFNKLTKYFYPDNIDFVFYPGIIVFMETQSQTYTAFDKTTLIAQGPLEEVVLAVKKKIGKSHQDSPILFFSDLTGKQMDFDLSGSDKEIVARLKVYLDPKSIAESSGPGRPKLGVVAREVSLLPKHWEWLSTQTGGASAIIRRLIETEMKTSSSKETIKKRQECAYKFLSAIAGDLPSFEEVIRALYAKDKKKFKDMMNGWPKDIKTHALHLSEEVFS